MRNINSIKNIFLKVLLFIIININFFLIKYKKNNLMFINSEIIFSKL